MSKIIGIDLGTTNSVVAVWEGMESRILSNSYGHRTTPSVVAFTPDGERLVGTPARNQQVTNPQSTVYSIKRFMGRRHSEVLSEEKIVPYAVVGRPEEFVRIQVGRRRLGPQELSAMILRELKETAEAHLGETVTRAVITVPAYFNDSQRQATKDAGEIAGLKVERIINEPTAAALAYGLEQKEDKRIVVFDLGGGTFDLSLMEIGKGTFRVIAVHGNTHLGGDDFDQRIIDIVADDFRRRERFDPREDPMALQRLKEAAERAKVDLSARLETAIMLPFIAVDGNGPKHLQYNLTRDTFEAVCKDLFDDVRDCCKRLMQDAGMTGGHITDVVMVGGATRIPRVQEIAQEVFTRSELDRSINPDEVVALGAATLGGVLAGDVRNVKLMDVTSRTLGVETVKGGTAKLITKNAPIPTSVRRVFSTPRDNQTSVPINVVEGESRLAKDNRSLGRFQLTGIPKAPAGKPQIEVEFTLDIDGILQVRATDKATSRSQKIVIENGVGLDRTELERMQRESQDQQDERKAKRESVDTRVHAERVHGDITQWLQYNGEMLPAKTREGIMLALHRLEKKIEKGDKFAIRAALKKIDEVMRPHRKAS